MTGACSNSGGNNRAPTEKVSERTAAVGTGGAGANLKSDSAFLQDVGQKNAAAIQLSRMALSNNTNADIRAFAQKVFDEDGGVQGKLKSALSGQPTEWPNQLDEKGSKTAGELAKNQGADFDRA